MLTDYFCNICTFSYFLHTEWVAAAADPDHSHQFVVNEQRIVAANVNTEDLAVVTKDDARRVEIVIELVEERPGELECSVLNYRLSIFVWAWKLILKSIFNSFRSRSRSRSYERDRRLRSRSYSPMPSSSAVPERIHVSEADLEGKSAEEVEMMRTMGFCGFDTTKNKKVEGNNVGEVHVILKRKYRWVSTILHFESSIV